MKLIKELSQDVKMLCEEDSNTGGKKYYLEGIFMQAERANRNRRIYPSVVLENAVRKYQEDYVTQNRAMGELGHPDNPTINLDRVSHIITELKQSGSDWVGRAKLLDEMPMGKIAVGLVKEGVKLGVSSRALGTLKEIKEGLKEVQNDLLLKTVDIVAEPSAPDAFVEGILEGKEWVFDHGNFIERQATETKKKIQKRKSLTEEQKITMFANFINSFKA